MVCMIIFRLNFSWKTDITTRSATKLPTQNSQAIFRSSALKSGSFFIIQNQIQLRSLNTFSYKDNDADSLQQSSNVLLTELKPNFYVDNDEDEQENYDAKTVSVHSDDENINEANYDTDLDDEGLSNGDLL